MEDYQIKTIKHPLFGEIMTSQDSEGNVLYRAKEIGEYYGIDIRYFPKEIKAVSIPVNVVNNLGYAINIHMRFLDSHGIMQLLIFDLERDIRKCIKTFREYALELDEHAKKSARAAKAKKPKKINKIQEEQ